MEKVVRDGLRKETNEEAKIHGCNKFQVSGLRESVPAYEKSWTETKGRTHKRLMVSVLPGRNEIRRTRTVLVMEEDNMLDIIFALFGAGSRYMAEEKNRDYNRQALERAKKRGDKVWWPLGGGGGAYTVQEFPRKGFHRCNFKTSEDGRRDLYIDEITNRIVCDWTEELNKSRTEKSRQNAKERGSKFYVTHEFNDKKGRLLVYKNDSMPGRYFMQTGSNYRECLVKKQTNPILGCLYEKDWLDDAFVYDKTGKRVK